MKAWSGSLSAAVLALALAAGLTSQVRAQGVTSAAITGVVAASGATREPVAGADVTLTKPATGESHVVTTRSDGRYTIDNASAGGPYTLEVRAIGFQPVKVEGLRLTLGQRLSHNVALQRTTVQLEDITVVTQPSILDDVSRTGASTVVSDTTIQRMPLQGRNFTDLIQTAPQVNGNSVAGQNNRFNNIQVDGGVNNDLFGLAGSGTPGGQANATVISLEAIQEFQVQVAPFDVRQGNFVGGLVNAVTKSGTNEYHGSLFGYYRGKSLAGQRDDPTFSNFNVYQYGGTFSGPIMRDKLQFFLSADLQSSSSSFSSSNQLTGDDATDIANVGFTLQDAQDFRDVLVNQYGFGDPGDGTAPPIENPDNNLFGKLSWQIAPNSRLEISHNWVDASQDQLIRNPTSPRFSSRLRDGYQLSNSGYGQANRTNTTRLKWTTTFGDNFANEFLSGGQWIRDHREIANELPLILVRAGESGSDDSWLAAGADRFSQGNLLNQDIYSVADNLSFNVANSHRLTVGTSDEFFKFHNVFTQGSFGSWMFASLDSLRNGEAEAFEITLPGDPNLAPNGAVADFSVKQIGAFLQDQWTLSRRATVTAGIRVDVPFFSSPVTNPNLTADPDLPINTGVFPSGNALWSPRLGFNVDASGDGNTVVRGGVGIFTGRPAYVWLSNAYVGTGLETVTLTCVDADVPAFPASPVAGSPTSCAGGGGPSAARANPVYFDQDFRFPQSFRAALGLDRQLPEGIVGTLDFLYTANRNNLYIQDNNLVEDAVLSGEGRYLYGTFNPTTGRATKNLVRGDIGNALFHRNENGGNSVSITAQLSKAFSNGLSFNAGYTYSKTKDIYSLTSSIAFSNYQFASVDGSLFDRNVTTSSFDVPHKVTISGTANLPYHSQFSLIYQGFSGTPYGWTVGSDVNGDGISGNDLPYVPSADGTDITLADPSQLADLNAFIDGQKCLAGSRGHLLERNSCRNPWTNLVNTRLATSLPLMSGHAVELSWDIFNVLNMFDNEWGAFKQVSAFEEGPSFLRAVGYDAANNRPIYNFSPPDADQIVKTVRGPNSSRWRMQFGAKYSF
ncbi:MAG TPA: carboxypeptidase regulatory-like domain-containing protein [Gemmatimonadales bacterium]|nr:carboxypeptidase regulatory-like domain-containing protein [Gemmatimonadales bacterium]